MREFSLLKVKKDEILNNKIYGGLIVGGCQPQNKPKGKFFNSMLQNFQKNRERHMSKLLMQAISINDETKIVKLIQKGANVNLPFNGVYPIHAALEANYYQAFRGLMTAPKINMEVRNKNGLTPFLASIFSAPTCLMYMLRHDKADINAVVEKTGMSALHITARLGMEILTQAIIEAENLKNKPYVNLRDKKGNTPLHYAAVNGNEEIYSLLKSAGAVETLKNLEGKTPAEMADRAAQNNHQQETAEKEPVSICSAKMNAQAFMKFMEQETRQYGC